MPIAPLKTKQQLWGMQGLNFAEYNEALRPPTKVLEVRLSVPDEIGPTIVRQVY